MDRRACLAFTILALAIPAVAPAQPEKAPAPKAAADPLAGPPHVCAKAWVVVNGQTGKVLAGGNEAEARPMASTSKIMTAWIVLQLAADDSKVLDEVVTFSANAARTTGTSAKLLAGEKVTVKDLLYGLLLPSGNDAAVALAEHFGGRFGTPNSGDVISRFVSEMNRRAKSLGLKEMSYRDPHGLSAQNVSSARDLAVLAREVMKGERFLGYVATRQHDCEVVEPGGGKRKVTWVNTNKLLDIEGYEGIKTGTTTPAGYCLVSAARRGKDRLIVVVLGSTSTEGRYIDSRNLYRWGWLELGHSPEPKREK
jgi:D-alanyl-D-alanine carboxypeptidase (penicillin-binding protein 5/6)